MPIVHSRRRFLSSVALTGSAGLAMAGAVGILDVGALGREPSPENTEIRLKKVPIYCEGPQYVAEELLRAEGISIRDVAIGPSVVQSAALAHGDFDFGLLFAPEVVMALEAGLPITALAGVHNGCFELFGNERIRGIADLKDRTVGAQSASTATQLVTIMASYIGLDPAKDLHWVIDPTVTPLELFSAGRIDAFLAVPPESLELRARNIGHVILNSSVDRPWSQYFCCMLMGNAEFVLKHPGATKRWIRAVLKGNDLCASEPARVARLMVDRGFADRYDYALQTLNEVPYGDWRDSDPEDTLRFYALRLREAGFIRSSPQTIMSRGTDWRFLNELKRELKT